MIFPLANTTPSIHLPSLLMVALVTISGGCDSSENPETNEESLGFLREARRFGGPDDIGTVMDLQPVGKYLVVTDQMRPPHVLVYDRTDGRLISRFGESGRGPGEFLGSSYIAISSHDLPEIWLFDRLNARISVVGLADSQVTPGPSEPFHVNAPIMDLFLRADEIIATGFFHAASFVLFSPTETNVVREVVVDPPFPVDDYPRGQRLHLNASRLAVSPNGEHIAVAFRLANRIDFFDATGEKLTEVIGPVENRVSYRGSPSGGVIFQADNQYAYESITATDDHVFALFNGTDRGDQIGPQKLHVFNWQGRLVAMLEFDRVVWRIRIDRAGQMLYGYVQDPYPYVGEWHLPSFDNE